MAKNDFNVIVYKVLLYYYGILKREYTFNIDVFYKTVDYKNLDTDYFNDVLKMMTDEGLIKGMKYTKVWQGVFIPITDYEDIHITLKGIEYINSNSSMQKVKEFFLGQGTGFIVELIKKVFGL